MSNEPENSKQRILRSPAYPLFNLEVAVSKIRILHVAQRHHETNVDSAIRALGFTGTTGPSARTIAALDQYGLLEQTGTKDLRRVKITDLARDIIELPQTDPRVDKALKTCALLPTIHQHLWERYENCLPDSKIIQAYLTRDKDFNDSVVATVVENYRNSLTFAKLDKLDESSQNISLVNDPEKPISSSAGGVTISTPVDTPRPPLQIQHQMSASPFQSNPLTQELPILVDHGQVARIPFPMSEDAYELLIGTLQLWKKKLVPPSAPPAATTKISTSSPKNDQQTIQKYPVPISATWNDEQTEMEVSGKIVGLKKNPDKPDLYVTEDGEEIPISEVNFLTT